MRFSKRVKICPGFSLNLSKSGVGFSVGPRGLKYSSGPNGSYITGSIPGTGISSRQKIGSTSKARTGSKRVTTETTIKITLNMDEDTGIITVLDQFGNAITDEGLLRKIRRNDSYKAAKENLNAEVKQKIDAAVQNFIDIHKLTPTIIPEKEWQVLLQSQPDFYSIASFVEPKPTKKEIEIELWGRARREISSIFFWRNKSLREKFVNENLECIYSERQKSWQLRKNEFEFNELKREEVENNKILMQHNEQMLLLKQAISGDVNFVNGAIERILQSISLPVEFSIDYEYVSNTKSMYVDLDLPEIEDLPIKKATITASGKLSIKEKTQKEIRYDYAQCVMGLAFFFAAQFFNISPVIDNIVISGYTQRVSKKTGNLEDDYIYSVQFKRSAFGKLNFENINPIDAFDNFPNRLIINRSFEFKSVVPIGQENGLNIMQISHNEEREMFQ